MLKYMLRTTSLSLVSTMYLRLYVNDFTPTDTSVVGDFTEASWSGYSAYGLNYSSWTFSTTNSLVTAIYSGTPEFSCTDSSSHTVYGWYIYTATPGLIASRRFDNAVVFQQYGVVADFYNLTLSLL